MVGKSASSSHAASIENRKRYNSVVDQRLIADISVGRGLDTVDMALVSCCAVEYHLV